MTDDRPYRAGGLKMTRTSSDGEPTPVFVGEATVAELMASVLPFVSQDTAERVPILEALGYVRLGVDPVAWLAALRASGWSVTVDTDTMTFTIVRG